MWDADSSWTLHFFCDKTFKTFPVESMMQSTWKYRILLGILHIACIYGRKLASWRGPTSFLLGNFPAERESLGVTEALGMIFVFGGKNRTAGMALILFNYLLW